MDFECTPWGTPTYNLFGWQKPCYLLQDGYVPTFKELMEDTKWENYGRKSGNTKCTRLHGALRLRARGRARHLQFAARLCSNCPDHIDARLKPNESASSETL